MRVRVWNIDSHIKNRNRNNIPWLFHIIDELGSRSIVIKEIHCILVKSISHRDQNIPEWGIKGHLRNHLCDIIMQCINTWTTYLIFVSVEDC